MKASQTLRPLSLTLLLLPLTLLLFVAAVTIVGLVWRMPSLVAMAGLSLLFSCFIVFAFADRWLLRLRQLRSSKKLSTYLSVSDSTARDILEFLADLPVSAALIIRGLFLSLSFWIVSLFVGLCQGGVYSFLDAFKNNLVMTLFSISISVFDTVRGKTVSSPGWPTRLLAVWGFFQFFKGLYLLSAALAGPHSLRATELLFSNPIWFLFATERYQVLRIISDPYGFLMVLLGFGLFQIVVFFQGLEVLFRKPSPDNIDPKNCAVATVILTVWVLPLPIYYVGSFIYFMIG
jgi:hypothetical protein